MAQPHWSEQGNAPDYRFSLANERTFLAWIRTALVVAVIYAVIGLATVAASRAAGGAGMQTAVRVIRALSWLLAIFAVLALMPFSR